MKRIPVFLTLILLSVATMAQQRLTVDTILFKRGGKLYKLILYGDSLIINQTKYYTLPGFGSTAQYLRGDRTWQNLPTISPADTNLWALSGADIKNKNSGKVGVGVTGSPLAKLHVFSENSTTALAATSQSGHGVYGKSGPGSYGVYGETTSGYGVYGKASSNNSYAGFFEGPSSNAAVYATGGTWAGYFTSPTYNGIYAESHANRNSGVFMGGRVLIGTTDATGTTGKLYCISSGSTSINGSSSGSNSIGINGNASSETGIGVYGFCGAGIGIKGQGAKALYGLPNTTNNWALWAQGKSWFDTTIYVKNFPAGLSTNKIITWNANDQYLTAIDIAELPTLPSDTNLWKSFGQNISNKNSGNVGIGTTSPDSLLAVSKGATFGRDIVVNGLRAGKGAGAYNQTSTVMGIASSVSTTSGSANTAFGYYTLNKNTTGFNNTAIGTQVLLNNINGIDNTAVGFDALHYNVIGSYNTALGIYAGFNSKGSNNTILGNRAMYHNSTGSHNIALGDSAGYNYNNLHYRMFLGAQDTSTTGIYFNQTPGFNKGYWLGALNIKTVSTGDPSTSLMIVHDTVTGDIKRLPLPSTQHDTSWKKSLSGVYSTEMISIGDSVPTDSALNVTGGVNVTGGLKVSGQIQSDYRLRLDQGLSVGTSNSDAALNIGYGGIRIDGPLELDEKPTYLWALDPQGYLKTTPLDSVSNPTDTSHLSIRIDQKLSIADSNQYATPYDLSQIRSSQWTTSGDHLYYTTGMVGIGITNPSYSIHSSGDIMANGVRFGQGSYAGNNTCFGTGTLGVNQSGTYNLALGAGSMGQLDAGSYNVGVGPSTLYNIYNGNGNTALGVRALYNQSGGDTTIGIGFEAGRYNVSGGITDASNSIYIGGNTKGSGFYPLNEIAIGHDATGNGNNTLTLGHTTITKTFLRGSVVYNPSNTGNITAATGITAAMLSADMRYTGDSGIDITANPQIADGTDGQQISIVGLSDSNTLTLDDGDGLTLSGQMILGGGDVITLRYIGSLDTWIEISRSNN